MGRDDELNELDEHFQNNEYIGIRGMGGIGKTELALRYAKDSYNANKYPGGVCWLQARDQEIATQIINFAKANLGIKPPDDLEADKQVRFIWQRWPQGDALIILDDVTDYDAIKVNLPPEQSRFKILLTTRNRFGGNIQIIELGELKDTKSIELIEDIVLKFLPDDKRINNQRSDVEALCKWVGHLPLGLELLGRFLVKKPDWSVSKLLERLESKRLEEKALVSSESGMTASLGVAATLELSWTELDNKQQDLARLLAMFAVAPIPWFLVEQCFAEKDTDNLENWRDALCDRSLIRRVDEGKYQLHQIVQEFFREKLTQLGEYVQSIGYVFVKVMVRQANSIEPSSTLRQTSFHSNLIPHLQETVNSWINTCVDDYKYALLNGLALFFESQFQYPLAEQYHRTCLNMLSPESLSYIASTLNNLSVNLMDQGQYENAKICCLKALKIREKLCENRNTVNCLITVARCEIHLMQLNQAMNHAKRALEINNRCKDIQKLNHTNCLNLLASIYKHQGLNNEAEKLYESSLTIRREHLNFGHESLMEGIHCLAQIYECNNKLIKAEPLFIEVLEYNSETYGVHHPSYAKALNNLACLYFKQERYQIAEQYFLEALAIFRDFFADNHPCVGDCYSNLGFIYYETKKYQRAKLFFMLALEIYHDSFGCNHPRTQNVKSRLSAIPEYIEPFRLEELDI